MEDKKQTIPEMSVDARLLMARLQRVEIGEVVTYETLTAEIKRDVQKTAYGALNTARNSLMRDDGILFETVRKVGMKRLAPSEIARGVGEVSIKKISREAKRGTKKLRCALNGELSNEDLVRLHTDVSILGALSEFTKPKAKKLIEAKAKTKSSELAIGETLSLMK